MKIFIKKYSQLINEIKGLTLVEVAITLMIIAVVTTALISVINPTEQFAKA